LWELQECLDYPDPKVHLVHLDRRVCRETQELQGFLALAETKANQDRLAQQALQEEMLHQGQMELRVSQAPRVHLAILARPARSE